MCISIPIMNIKICPLNLAMDIIDFYLQYKPILNEYISHREHYPEFDSGNFTKLLFKYEMFDVDYANSIAKMKENMEKIR